MMQSSLESSLVSAINLAASTSQLSTVNPALLFSPNGLLPTADQDQLMIRPSTLESNLTSSAAISDSVMTSAADDAQGISPPPTPTHGSGLLDKTNFSVSQRRTGLTPSTDHDSAVSEQHEYPTVDEEFPSIDLNDDPLDDDDDDMVEATPMQQRQSDSAQNIGDKDEESRSATDIEESQESESDSNMNTPDNPVQKPGSKQSPPVKHPRKRQRTTVSSEDDGDDSDEEDPPFSLGDDPYASIWEPAAFHESVSMH
jgi:hypothetical protein